MAFYTPDQNDGNHVFVFGSNLAGRHGRGAAFTAKRFWGARNGVGEGIQGNAYGIPTKDRELRVLPLGEIRRSVKRFLEYAENNPQKTFLVTEIGCGLAGYSPRQIGPLFINPPGNCVLPASFKSGM
jgi:hypothetical protein